MCILSDDVRKNGWWIKVDALGISFHFTTIRSCLGTESLSNKIKHQVCNLSDAVRKGGWWMKVDALGISFLLTSL